MTLALYVHCDGLVDGRRCLSHASVRSDPGEPRVDPANLETALTRGLWAFYPDAGDGVECGDVVAPDAGDPWHRSTAWAMATSVEPGRLAFRMLCPLH